MEEQPTEQSYLTRASGRHLGSTMPMWRVQTEGYSDGNGMLIGVVSPSKVLYASPDSEFISSGKNSKGVDSVALGRQGSFFHWGFAASPTYMTEEAKLVFVNALHYISRFRGQRAITKKRIYATRAELEDMYYTLSDEGFSKWQDMLSEIRKESEKERKELQEKLADGQELTEQEQVMLKAPPMREYTRFDLVSLPEKLKDRFGEDWDRYVKYYRENEDYLHSPDAESGRGFFLDVDPVVKEFGIPNHSIKLLDHAIGLLGKEDECLKEKALTTLKRYTEEDFPEADEWQHWLDTYRDYLYFSDVAGFKFLVNTNALPASLKEASKLQDEVSKFETIVSEIDVPRASNAEPIQFKAVLRRVETPKGSRIRLIVKTKIQHGWHLYAHVPKTAPYIQTKFEASEVSNLSVSGQWEKSVGFPSVDDPSVLIWENDALIWRDYVEVEEGKKVELELEIRYQACDTNRCLPPKTVKFDLEF